MTTSSEDVLLQMGEVRYKKGDGTLYVMNERVAWMAEHRDTVTVSHRYADIKTQKISPEGKPKVQLQVVLHDGNTSTFHFVNRQGQAAMLADRDKVKELLQQLLPNFKRKVDKDLEDKNRILVENPNLLQLYKDLVITKVLTSDEFWATHAKDHALKKMGRSQEIGVSGAFLADIKPQTDGCNGLKYNLTSDVIHCIFKTYPAVKRKHFENVPAKMSEAEFWTKFFQSHYFHRDRLTAGTKDIFTECGKIDDQALKAAVQQGAGDPLLDLKKFEDVPLEEGFGSVAGDRNVVNSGNIVHQNMIKRFNQHSIMVLKTCANVTSAPSTMTNGTNNANGPVSQSAYTNGMNGKAQATATKSSADQVDKDEPQSKKQRLMEKIHYEDLGDPLLEEEDDPANGEKAKSKQFELSKVERYLNGPVQNSMYDNHNDPMSLEEVQYKLVRNSESWLNRNVQRTFICSKAAVNALGELSPGGSMMRGFQEQSAGQLVPNDFQRELRHLYLSLSELLKHFWSCFPPTTEELETKLHRMHETLQRFKMAKLVPFENRAMHELSPLRSSLTQHMNQLLRTANSKFATWKERKLRNNR
ncbi:general transcription factor IIH subunit 1 [Drosophila sechellia]|uniref:General transcription factor IIH subunit 1 n=1 Tax=Drosophila sechellia TaxID=7238 RepID=B4HRB5_DROSE|nr:general transcription factor IIH subunit 1 [Drosophila sechellia]XP_032571387.1 general transcription factor IIH subunit 1 [Drosophila sechellia]XP_032571388.1 general transcription factor IIH subunit 1 [Drosophila sechellia]EDW47844.1 GM21534 [Drosophila sechellia]